VTNGNFNFNVDKMALVQEHWSNGIGLTIYKIVNGSMLYHVKSYHLDSIYCYHLVSLNGSFGQLHVLPYRARKGAKIPYSRGM
jgi:hypothetical protein